ncbi:hypothetical protein C1645_835154 [Glomus cerebriforme]|uniref:Uncharacterized protein n=1 Tax=Glomus cerebriforme TaxID=658196 RepID=A0A397SAU1_9GLOM|nr:hypothetical protein C1645_835154 [Glomus cerebriforme]
MDTDIATIQDIMQILVPLLVQLPNYDGQEPPEEYYQKLQNINKMAHLLAVASFNTAARTNIMKSKMAERFTSVLSQNPYNANTNIITEPEFLNWLQNKY